MKLLVLSGAKYNCKNKDGHVPLDFALYNSETRQVLEDALKGILPEIVVVSEVGSTCDFCEIEYCAVVTYVLVCRKK